MESSSGHRSQGTPGKAYENEWGAVRGLSHRRDHYPMCLKIIIIGRERPQINMKVRL